VVLPEVVVTTAVRRGGWWGAAVESERRWGAGSGYFLFFLKMISCVCLNTWWPSLQETI
jgi:hypothetical protein